MFSAELGFLQLSLKGDSEAVIKALSKGKFFPL